MNRPIALLAVVAIPLFSSGASLVGALGPPPAAQSAAQPVYQPDRPYELQADGVLSRRAFRTDGAGPFRAEITDLIVPPGKAATLRYEGIVVVDTREGTGHATVQDRPVALRTGATFGLSQGQSARVENNGKQPLLLRVYVVTTQ
jgi:hypothetical protein